MYMFSHCYMYIACNMLHVTCIFNFLVILFIHVYTINKEVSTILLHLKIVCER